MSTSAPKFSFSLSSKPKLKPVGAGVGVGVGAAPSLKRPAAFDDSNEPLESLDAAPTASSSSRTEVNKRLIAQGSTKLSRAEKMRIEKEKAVDATVYEYDEVWDRMKDAEKQAKEVREEETKERKVRPIITCTSTDIKLLRSLYAA